MKDFENADSEVIDLGKATVETKGAGQLFVDAGIGKQNSTKVPRAHNLLEQCMVAVAPLLCGCSVQCMTHTPPNWINSSEV